MRVARELDRLLGERGKPTTIVSDNGSELSSETNCRDNPLLITAIVAAKSLMSLLCPRTSIGNKPRGLLRTAFINP